MHIGSRALAAGADFRLLAPDDTMLDVDQAGRRRLRRPDRLGQEPDDAPRRGAPARRRQAGSPSLRHPMPYGDLTKQAVQRFETLRGSGRGRTPRSRSARSTSPTSPRATSSSPASTTARSSTRAEQEADVILWDGGNNDTPFIKPDLHVVVVDPHRPGHELRYHPGETNLRMADVCVVNKVDSAPPGGDRRRARLDPDPQPRRAHRARGLAVPRRGRRERDRRQARARDRGRADADPRRDDLRRRPSSRPRRTARPSSSIRATRGRLDRADVRGLPEHRRRCSRRWATARSRWTS